MTINLCSSLPDYTATETQTPDGLRLSIQDYGKVEGGRDILFIHGFSQSNLSWLKQVQSSLKTQHHLITCDMRGHGASDTPDDLNSFKDTKVWADDINSIIEAANLVKPVIVAWSYSGRIVLDYLKIYGADSISALVMVAATSTTKDGVLGPLTPALKDMAMATDLAENISATSVLLDNCVTVPMPADESGLMLGFNLLTPVAVRAAMAGRVADYDDVLKNLTLPMLIVQGADDPINTVRMSEHTSNLVKHAKLLIYPECGHLPFWEYSERFNNDLKTFLDTGM